MTLTFPAHDSARLTGRQVRALDAIMEGKSAAMVALAAGVNASTVWRWRTDDPVFRAALRAGRDAAFAEVLADLRHAAAAAVATCAELMRPAPPAQDRRTGARALRLAAAKVVIAEALRANEQIGVEERLRALEGRIR